VMSLRKRSWLTCKWTWQDLAVHLLPDDNGEFYDRR
jgi:hypothetical protein